MLAVDTASDGTDFVLALVNVVGGQSCRRGVAGFTGGVSEGLEVYCKVEMTYLCQSPS